MGGGGVSGTIRYPEYQQILHSIWMTDVGDEDNYDQLGLIIPNSAHDVITTAQNATNPYANPSTIWTDPDGADIDMGELEPLIESLHARIMGLSDADWSSFFQQALAHKDSLATLSMDTPVSDARGTGLSLREEVASIRGHAVEDSEAWKSFIDAARVKADEAGMLEEVDADLQASKAEANAFLVFQQLQQLINFDAADEDVWTRLFAAVLTKVDEAGVLNDVDIASAVSTALSGAQSALQQFFTNKQTGLNEQTDWNAFVDGTVSKLDAVGVLKDIDAAAVATAASTLAEAEILQGFTLLSNITHDPETDWASAIDAAVTKIDALNVLKDIDTATIVSNARGGATSAVSAAHASALTGINESTDWQGFVDDVVAKVDTLGVLKNIDVDAIAAAAVTGSNTELDAAVAKAIASVDTSVIQAALDAFETRQDFSKNRIVNRFAGAMADINAVHSSTFMLGLALIESQHAANLSEFQSQLAVGLYGEVTRLHIEAYRTVVQAEIQARVLEKQARDNLVRQGVQDVSQILQVRAQYEQAWMALHIRAYEAQLQLEMQARSQEKSARDQLLEAGALHMMRMLEAKMGYEQTLFQLQRLYHADRQQAGMQAEVVKKQNRDQLLGQGMEQLTRMLINRTQYEQTYIQAELQAYLGQLQVEAQGAAQNKEAREAMIQSGMAQLLQYTGGRQGLEQSAVQAFTAAYNGQLQSLFNAAQFNAGRDQEFINAAAATMAEMQRTRTSIESTVMQAHMNAFLAHLRGQLSQQLVTRQTELEMAMDGTTKMLNLALNPLQMEQSALNTMGEFKRLRFVATHEYEGAKVDSSRDEVMWGIRVLQNGLNLLAAPGNAHPLPDKPSRAASTIGGALGGAGAGASAGAAIGAAGGPIGAAGGALIGAGLGALSGALA